ncbi:MAG: DUF899 family protein [Phycisphaerales bacterium]
MNDDVRALQGRIDELQKQLGEARRRAAPEPVRDYTLTTPDGAPVLLSRLFGSKGDLVLIHNMGRRCVYCTLWADGITGFTKHLEDRAAFALASPDEPAVLRDFASSRGWNFTTVSSHGTTFGHDLGFEPDPGKPWPGVSAFRKRPDGSIVRTGRASFGPGDSFCAIWHLFDLLEGGVGEWGPKFRYE